MEFFNNSIQFYKSQYNKKGALSAFLFLVYEKENERKY
ncbi:hypothetical protein LEP1GSC109_3909 [Leptospira interrogans str. UI 13372]|uniref:Uncharacterized protein n=1 Tax=Leptospira interrogans str. 2002000626 TaxID=996803 RepID=A0A829D200_LEPIR|nr:hypothetical protein LEP1GSC109_3909 [Leptospira interrogans str. UI 13372]EMY02929.1 hypothetical protein LEP1GSC029_1989 [Leptospira interrogans str. 2002000626]